MMGDDYVFIQWLLRSELLAANCSQFCRKDFTHLGLRCTPCARHMTQPCFGEHYIPLQHLGITLVWLGGQMWSD
jgi:hypothetical protein